MNNKKSNSLNIHFIPATHHTRQFLSKAQPKSTFTTSTKIPNIVKHSTMYSTTSTHHNPTNTSKVNQRLLDDDNYYILKSNQHNMKKFLSKEEIELNFDAENLLTKRQPKNLKEVLNLRFNSNFKRKQNKQNIDLVSFDHKGNDSSSVTGRSIHRNVCLDKESKDKDRVHCVTEAFTRQSCFDMLNGSKEEKTECDKAIGASNDRPLDRKPSNGLNLETVYTKWNKYKTQNLKLIDKRGESMALNQLTSALKQERKSLIELNKYNSINELRLFKNAIAYNSNSKEIYYPNGGPLGAKKRLVVPSKNIFEQKELDVKDHIHDISKNFIQSERRKTLRQSPFSISKRLENDINEVNTKTFVLEPISCKSSNSPKFNFQQIKTENSQSDRESNLIRAIDSISPVIKPKIKEKPADIQINSKQPIDEHRKSHMILENLEAKIM